MVKNARVKSCKRPEKKLGLYFRLILKIQQLQLKTKIYIYIYIYKIKSANPGKWGESDYHIITFKYPV